MVAAEKALTSLIIFGYSFSRVVDTPKAIKWHPKKKTITSTKSSL